MSGGDVEQYKQCFFSIGIVILFSRHSVTATARNLGGSRRARRVTSQSYECVWADPLQQDRTLDSRWCRDNIIEPQSNSVGNMRK